MGKSGKKEGFRIGDRVVAISRHGGGNAKFGKFHVSCISHIPDTLDASQVVCLANSYMTAYQALRIAKKDGTPLTGANVMVTDGFSPVGQACVELAKLEGAKVYVTTTEKTQDKYMKSMGAKCVPEDPSKWLSKLKGKMDVVIDNTCLDSYGSSWKALNSQGILVCTGMSSIYSIDNLESGCGCDAFGDTRDFQAKWAEMKAKFIMSQTVFHDTFSSMISEPKLYQQEMKYLCFLLENGRIKPKVAERVKIEEVPDSQR